MIRKKINKLLILVSSVFFTIAIIRNYYFHEKTTSDNDFVDQLNYLDPLRLKEILENAEKDNLERIKNVKKVCENHRLHSAKNFETPQFKEPPAPQYNVFYIDRIHKLSYCPIYKAASTTWIYNMCLLMGLGEDEIFNGKEQLSTVARRVMPELSYPEADKILQSTTKLLIVRHPFERLLSAYRDKLENSVAGREHGTLHFYKKYGASIVRKFRDKNIPVPNSNQYIRKKGIPQPAGTEPTWREFVEYLINTDLSNYADDHWIPYYLFCTPCLVNYDFIAKVETLLRDQVFIIQKLGLNGTLAPRWRHRTSNSYKSLPSIAARKYFSQLSKTHVRQLFLKYQLDFQLFNYSADEYYDLATSSSFTRTK